MTRDPFQEPQRYSVQFTASEEYVALLDEARDLLSHAEPGRSIEAIHLRAMRTLVEQLRKKRRADVRNPRQRKNANPTSEGDSAGFQTPRQRDRAGSSVSGNGNAGSQTGPDVPRQRDAKRAADTCPPRSRARFGHGTRIAALSWTTPGSAVARRATWSCITSFRSPAADVRQWRIWPYVVIVTMV